MFFNPEKIKNSAKNVNFSKITIFPFEQKNPNLKVGGFFYLKCYNKFLKMDESIGNEFGGELDLELD